MKKESNERTTRDAATAETVELITPHGVGEVLNARGPLDDDEHGARLPQVAYAWHRNRWGGWSREDAEEYGVALAASVFMRDGKWVGLSDGTQFDSAEAAKEACDADLRARGWLIDETAVRPDRESPHRCEHDTPLDSYCERCELALGETL